MINALTIDVDDWYQCNGLGIEFNDWDRYESRIVNNTIKILSILAKNDVKATFFVLGYTAENFPELVLRIKREGHEIATHGYSHRLIYRQKPEEFASELKKSTDLLEGITNEKILGHRAASWSITKDTFWALDILEEQGLRYDSSIYPTRTFLYGIPQAPRFPHLIKTDNGSELIEFPPSTVRLFGINIPMVGGFYLRFFPYPIVKWGIERINGEGEPALVYIHPWDLDVDQPKLNLPFKMRILHYTNLVSTEEKLRRLLNEFKFTSIRDALFNYREKLKWATC